MLQNFLSCITILAAVFWMSWSCCTWEEEMFIKRELKLQDPADVWDGSALGFFLHKSVLATWKSYFEFLCVLLTVSNIPSLPHRTSHWKPSVFLSVLPCQPLTLICTTFWYCWKEQSGPCTYHADKCSSTFNLHIQRLQDKLLWGCCSALRHLEFSLLKYTLSIYLPCLPPCLPAILVFERSPLI